MNLRRLEWIGIALPVVFLALYHYLLVGPGHGLFHSTAGIAFLVAFLGVIVAAFSRVMFRAVGRRQEGLEALSMIVSRQNAQLRALNEANLALAEETLVAPVLQRVVDLARELVQARYAALSVLGPDGELSAFLTSGITAREREAIPSLPSGRGLLGLMLRREEPLRADDIVGHPASIGFPDGHPLMTTFLGAPIRYRGDPVGSLYLTEKPGGEPFTSDDEDIVRLFANQAAVAIHNARLYEQVQALAVETERSRISREMHDGLAQVLSYVMTKAQAVQEFLARGDTPTAGRQLDELSTAARQVYADVREGILALRADVGTGRNLEDALEEYIKEYDQRFDGTVSMSWGANSSGLALTPLQEVQVIRIVQEALTNVRKHAEAGHIWVNFTHSGDELHLEVRDDGRGFNPLAVRRGEWPHLGLQTMQERAEAVGGHFEVESEAGQGTTVRARLPVPSRAGPGEDTS